MTAEIIVVGSGKGGVGKSVMSILLGSAFADAGERILLLDGDQNLANLHVLLGIQPAALPHVSPGSPLPDAAVRQVSGGLWLLPGASGAESLHGLGALDRSRIYHSRLQMGEGFSRVIVDAGAGLDSVMRAVTMNASRLVLVTAPEPAALSDAYAVVKLVASQVRAMPVHVLVNRADDAEDGRAAYDRLATACERFLHRGVHHLGTILEDPALRAAVRDPHRLLPLLRETAAAQQVRDDIVERLGCGDAQIRSLV